MFYLNTSHDTYTNYKSVLERYNVLLSSASHGSCTVETF